MRKPLIMLVLIAVVSLFCLTSCSPTDPVAEYNAGLELVGQKDYPAALERAKKCVRMNREDIDAIKLQTLCAFSYDAEESERQSALQNLKRMVKNKAKEDYQAYFFLGWAYFQMYNYSEAQEYLTEAYKLMPKESMANSSTELTTYYVRAYAVTKTAGTIVSDVQSVTTPKAPIFPIDGMYIATEWDYNQDTGEWDNGGQYEMAVTFDESDPTIVNITNIWDGGMTIQGQYDAAKGIVLVPNMQVIYVHAKYGDVWIRGVNSAVTAYTSAVQFKFTALGGKMESTPMGAICAAGSFGYFYVTMEHQ